jgi:hypothetical protein
MPILNFVLGTNSACALVSFNIPFNPNYTNLTQDLIPNAIHTPSSDQVRSDMPVSLCRLHTKPDKKCYSHEFPEELNFFELCKGLGSEYVFSQIREILKEFNYEL